MNVLTCVGRLTKDAVKGVTKSGKPVLEFTVANDVGFGDNGSTNFYRCAMFGKRAEGKLADFLLKGTQVCVSGSHRVREYTKKDKTSGYSSEILVNEVTLCGSSPAEKRMRETEPHKPTASPQNDGRPDLDDDIPF